eukprot:TRINITY_DN32534_c0_g1_i2.p1 TRINITY_DN32534_c0_g1~~TRINITY_DN32534_c0_g1_i2.p1  ORF type:complete len:115 (+),score=23.39 TRINITY_DN32534_c0_g1_i2:2-346(+)
MFAAVGWLPVLGYLLSSEEDPQIAIDAAKREAEEAIEIQNQLFQNRFGANSQPMRSIDDALLLVSNAKVIANTMDFIGNQTAQDNTKDIMGGLDGWMTDNDRNLIQIQKANAHH